MIFELLKGIMSAFDTFHSNPHWYYVIPLAARVSVRVLYTTIYSLFHTRNFDARPQYLGHTLTYVLYVYILNTKSWPSNKQTSHPGHCLRRHWAFNYTQVQQWVWRYDTPKMPPSVGASLFHSGKRYVGSMVYLQQKGQD